jgi:hypothetical protein
MSILNLVHPPAIEAETPVKVGVYQNKPLLFQDENGEINGIFADVLAYVAQEEGWKIEYVMGSVSTEFKIRKNRCFRAYCVFPGEKNKL